MAFELVISHLSGIAPNLTRVSASGPAVGSALADFVNLVRTDSRSRITGVTGTVGENMGTIELAFGIKVRGTDDVLNLFWGGRDVSGKDWGTSGRLKDSNIFASSGNTPEAFVADLGIRFREVNANGKNSRKLLQLTVGRAAEVPEMVKAMFADANFSATETIVFRDGNGDYWRQIRGEAGPKFIEYAQAQKFLMGSTENAVLILGEGGAVGVNMFATSDVPSFVAVNVDTPMSLANQAMARANRIRGTTQETYLIVSGLDPAITTGKKALLFDRFTQAQEALGRSNMSESIGLAIQTTTESMFNDIIFGAKGSPRLQELARELLNELQNPPKGRMLGTESDVVHSIDSIGRQLIQAQEIFRNIHEGGVGKYGEFYSRLKAETPQALETLAANTRELSLLFHFDQSAVPEAEAARIAGAKFIAEQFTANKSATEVFTNLRADSVGKSKAYTDLFGKVREELGNQGVKGAEGRSVDDIARGITESILQRLYAKESAIVGGTEKPAISFDLPQQGRSETPLIGGKNIADLAGRFGSVVREGDLPSYVGGSRGGESAKVYAQEAIMAALKRSLAEAQGRTDGESVSAGTAIPPKSPSDPITEARRVAEAIKNRSASTPVSQSEHSVLAAGAAAVRKRADDLQSQADAVVVPAPNVSERTVGLLHELGQGSLKVGDTVTLSDGNTYLVQPGDSIRIETSAESKNALGIIERVALSPEIVPPGDASFTDTHATYFIIPSGKTDSEAIELKKDGDVKRTDDAMAIQTTAYLRAKQTKDAFEQKAQEAQAQADALEQAVRDAGAKDAAQSPQTPQAPQTPQSSAFDPKSLATDLAAGTKFVVDAGVAQSYAALAVSVGDTRTKIEDAIQADRADRVQTALTPLAPNVPNLPNSPNLLLAVSAYENAVANSLYRDYDKLTVSTDQTPDQAEAQIRQATDTIARARADAERAISLALAGQSDPTYQLTDAEQIAGNNALTAISGALIADAPAVAVRLSASITGAIATKTNPFVGDNAFTSVAEVLFRASLSGIMPPFSLSRAIIQIPEYLASLSPEYVARLSDILDRARASSWMIIEISS